MQLRVGIGLSLSGLALLLAIGCGEEEPMDPPPPPPPPEDPCERVPDLDALIDPSHSTYDYSCEGDVAPANEPLPAATVPNDCTTGIWPDLDDTVDVCPTVSDEVRTDPDSGLLLPSEDNRPLPLNLPVQESGSFLSAGGASYPNTLRVVAWNMEYTANFEAQLGTLTTHPELADADLYLLNEVDRCTQRNGLRRAAYELAEALGGDYAYGVEFVELNIDRDIGGDTGQAIIARRPLTDVVGTCHSSQHDWFASEDEPRLGQRMVLHGEIPVGPESVRVYSVHLESNDSIAGIKRSEQSKELLDQAQALACGRPQILAGDLNAVYCGGAELDVLRSAGFIDAVGIAGDTGGTHTTSRRLDYIWTRGFTVVAGGVVRDLGTSDHDPIWVDLALE